MKNFLLLVTLLCFGYTYAQNDTWYAFFDENYNRGFKDANGKVMIEPKFSGFTKAVKFDQIMMAMEYITGKGYEDYYLLKNGRQFGHDSVYYRHLTFYCESEGLIPFVADSGIGMFNGEGKIAIPAMYNELWPCRNGYIIALSGAEEKWDEEIAFWDGGTYSLIDRNNKTIIEEFDFNSSLNLYSVQITDVPVTNPIRKSFKGTDGKFYSFIDNEKEFLQFFDGFLEGLTPEKLTANVFDVLIYKDYEKKSWIKKQGKECPNAVAIIKSLMEIKKPETDYFIMPGRAFVPEEMEPYFEAYLDNCGDINVYRFPKKEILVTYIEKDRYGQPVMALPDAPVTTKEGYEFYQESFTFLRTEQGYKLVEVIIK